MTKSYEYKIKNKKILNKEDEEFTFDNYISSTFNINTALNFTNYLNSNIFIILNIKKEHNVPGLYLSKIFFNDINNINNIGNKIIKNIDSEAEVLLHRNLKIKILKIKNINIKKPAYNSKSYSIKELYETNKKKVDIKKQIQIKLIYAESCPYSLPNVFIPENKFKYLCKML
jgi:hypothetical protein